MSGQGEAPGLRFLRVPKKESLIPVGEGIFVRPDGFFPQCVGTFSLENLLLEPGVKVRNH